MVSLFSGKELMISSIIFVTDYRKGDDNNAGAEDDGKSFTYLLLWSLTYNNSNPSEQCWKNACFLVSSVDYNPNC